MIKPPLSSKPEAPASRSAGRATHPVFLCLQAQTLTYPYADNPVVWDTGYLRDLSRVLAVAPTQVTDEVSHWAQKLSLGVKNEDSSTLTERDMRLDAGNLEPSALENLCQWHYETGHLTDDPVESEPEGLCAAASSFVLVLLVEVRTGEPLGYVAAGHTWSVREFDLIKTPVKLDTEVHEVWLAPTHRRRGLSRMLSSSLVAATAHTVLQMDASAPWPSKRKVPLAISFQGDVEAEGGAVFLQTCADTLAAYWSLTFEAPKHFKLASLEAIPRW